MPLVWCYGFEMDSATNLVTQCPSNFTQTGVIAWVTGGDQHGSGVTGAGTYAWRIDAGARFTMAGMFDAGTDYWISFAVHWTAYTALRIAWETRRHDGTGNNGFAIYRNSSGNLILLYSDPSTTTTLATSTAVTANGSWMTIAMKVTKSGNDYSAEVYVDGALFVSGTHTYAGAVYGFGGFYIQGAGNPYSYLDDIRIFAGDMAGDAAAAKAEGYVFAGQVSADSIDGSFTPSTAGDLFPCVEMGASVDWAKSISTTTDGDVCRLAMDSIGGAISGTADGVTVHAVCDTDSGMDDITLGMAESSVATPVYGTATDAQVVGVVSETFLTSNGSTAWTQASFDAANVVIKATS